MIIIDYLNNLRILHNSTIACIPDALIRINFVLYDMIDGSLEFLEIFGKPFF